MSIPFTDPLPTTQPITRGRTLRISLRAAQSEQTPMDIFRPRYSESDVLHCLKQSATLLDLILEKGRRADQGLPVEDQQALAQDLSTISSVLRFLGEKVIPTLASGIQGPLPLQDQGAGKLLARLSQQTAELELRFGAAPPQVN